MISPANPMRVCMSICKDYRIKKPFRVGRYESDQARCQTCDVWLDHNGYIRKDGSNAVKDSIG